MIIANSSDYYDVDHPFDEYQFALNITEGCNIDNCPSPNICLNKTVCACICYYANFYISPKIIDADNNYNLSISSNDQKYKNNDFIKNDNRDIKYCTYERKSQVTLSFLEVFFPGIGFFYTGFYAYGTIKFFISTVLYLIIILKLGRCFKKDRLPENSPSIFYAEYTRDLHFYLMVCSYVIIVLSMAIDLSLISFRVWKDPNGVNFQIRQIFNKFNFDKN